MKAPEFLEADLVLYLHDQALREYGGVHGVKNDMLLLSALYRPQNKFGYADLGLLDLFDLAAAYAFGLASNHAFNDGNKRTAWSCCVLFLRANGTILDIATVDRIEQMVRLASGQLPETAFAAWLRQSRRRS